jgi:hypothetical protein
VKFTVSPPDEPEAWGLPVGEFRARLIADFPEATLAGASSGRGPEARLLDFHIDMLSCTLHGIYSVDPPELRLEGDLPCCATLAIWFRGQLAVEQELVLVNDAYAAHVVLTPVSSPRDVIERFSA